MEHSLPSFHKKTKITLISVNILEISLSLRYKKIVLYALCQWIIEYGIMHGQVLHFDHIKIKLLKVQTLIINVILTVPLTTRTEYVLN